MKRLVILAQEICDMTRKERLYLFRRPVEQVIDRKVYLMPNTRRARKIINLLRGKR